MVEDDADRRSSRPFPQQLSAAHHPAANPAPVDRGRAERRRHEGAQEQGDRPKQVTDEAGAARSRTGWSAWSGTSWSPLVAMWSSCWPDAYGSCCAAADGDAYPGVRAVRRRTAGARRPRRDLGQPIPVGPRVTRREQSYEIVSPGAWTSPTGPTATCSARACPAPATPRRTGRRSRTNATPCRPPSAAGSDPRRAEPHHFRRAERRGLRWFTGGR